MSAQRAGGRGRSTRDQVASLRVRMLVFPTQRGQSPPRQYHWAVAVKATLCGKGIPERARELVQDSESDDTSVDNFDPCPTCEAAIDMIEAEF